MGIGARMQPHARGHAQRRPVRQAIHFRFHGDLLSLVERPHAGRHCAHRSAGSRRAMQHACGQFDGASAFTITAVSE